MSDVSILTSNNHELMALVRTRIEAQYPLAFIAQELDVELQDLIDWIMDVYKSPRTQKPYQNKGAGPIGKVGKANGNGWSVAEQLRRQSIWERQHKAAVAALKAMDA